MNTTVLATCNLNQWALDFSGNYERIRLSIERAREQGAKYRVGPELETCAYGCEDHFLEQDTFTHSWQVIARIIEDGLSNDILIDIGAPVLYHSVAYNCRVLLLNGQVVLIRPKVDLADDGNYRESRWFRAWKKEDVQLHDYMLPEFVTKVTSSRARTCPFGIAIVVSTDGVNVACETCEELWTPHPQHIDLYLAGVHIIANGSGSHHVLRKLNSRVDLIAAATRSSGGVYMYANQIGCDGGRLYYDGSALIALNGHILCQGSQFSLASEVEVITAVVDLDDVARYRLGLASRAAQASACTSLRHERIYLPNEFRMCVDLATTGSGNVTMPLQHVRFYSPAQEIAYGPACWLWDYLRRSGMSGFFLPLSGGADSSSVAVIVRIMCDLLVEETTKPDCDSKLLSDIRRVVEEGPDYIPSRAQELCGKILHTMYMGSDFGSSTSTKKRASDLAEELGAWHASINITSVVQAALRLLTTVFGEAKRPRFRVHGGSPRENLALQNIQARMRMVLAYVFAQLTPWARGRGGSLLVLGSANVDEGLRGYLTKYDCSSADINPIGGICKADLRMFLNWAAQSDGPGYRSLLAVIDAPPTAELEPVTERYVQTDETDMGMTYEELTQYGRLRKLYRCGPLSMYYHLLRTWVHYAPQVISEKVKHFFRMYAMHRHKLTTLTPSYHAEDYSPEDNRFDLRQFLYNTRWPWQFSRIDDDVARRDAAQKNHVMTQEQASIR